MGQVLAAYGVRGWLKARTFTATPSGLVGYPSWWLARSEASGDWREFAVRGARVHADAVVASLEGFSAREDVVPWRGASIAVPRPALPPLKAGEVYLADLMGIEVVNRQQRILGTVAGLIDTGAHPVLRVVGGGREPAERLIPLVPIYVDAVDLASRRIVVDWPADF
jgi:16S rRNA processing protein RimM